MSRAATGTLRVELDLATLLARGLVTLDDEDLEEGNLTLELGVTLWMTRAGARHLGAVRAALFELRWALLRASELSDQEEPIPLMAGDERTAVLALAVYLRGLLHRAAASTALAPAAMAEEALAVIQGGGPVTAHRTRGHRPR